MEPDHPAGGGVVHVLGGMGDDIGVALFETGEPRADIGYRMVEVDLHDPTFSFEITII